MRDTAVIRRGRSRPASPSPEIGQKNFKDYPATNFDRAERTEAETAWMGPGHDVERFCLHPAVRFCANGSEHRGRVVGSVYPEYVERRWDGPGGGGRGGVWRGGAGTGQDAARYGGARSGPRARGKPGGRRRVGRTLRVRQNLDLN